MGAKIIQLLILTIIFKINISQSARILVHCQTPSISHQIIYQPIIKELSLRGHQVVSITPDPLNDPTLVNLTEISVRFSYEGFNRQIDFSDLSKLGIAQTKFFKNLVYPINWEIIDKQLSHPDVKKLIEKQNEHFDLVIVEWFTTPLVAYSERFNCSLVGISSVGLLLATNEGIGNSINPSYYSDILLSFSEPNSFFKRLYSSLYNLWKLHFMYTVLFPEHNKVARKHFGEKITPFEQLRKRVSFVLSNSHPVIHGARPYVPAVIEIAGINKKPRKPLPQDLQEFLDNAEKGVIYFSFGTNVKGILISEEKRKVFTETFKSLPYKVLWKFESEELAGKPENVKTSKWFPQSDVLHHPNVKLFITQGGLQSWEEALHAEVPLIGFPFMADQFWNVDRMEKLGIGIKMDITTINKNDLTDAILEIMNNSKYYENIKKYSTLLNDQPMKPLDKAIYWIEFVLRHDDVTIFQSPTMTIPWYQYFLIDVISFCIFCVVVTAYVVYYTLKIILNILCYSKQTFKEKKN